MALNEQSFLQKPFILPPSPLGQTGWPWVEISHEEYQVNIPWPRISIVTPSLNQGKYLEACIRSILLQHYPNLEYFIIDGGSNDESTAIIQKYELWLSAWESAHDRGQAHALNKGFDKATGDLLGWVNSDDLLLAGALRRIALAHLENPHMILLGDVVNRDETKNVNWVSKPRNVTPKNLIEIWHENIRWQQPGLFFPRDTFDAVGHFDEGLHCIFDREWLVRALSSSSIYCIHTPVAQFRYHSASKTMIRQAEWYKEEQIFLSRYQQYIHPAKWELAQATRELRYATNLVNSCPMDRSLVIKHLLKALNIDRRILGLRRFWVTGLKTVVPYSIQMRIRNLLSGQDK